MSTGFLKFPVHIASRACDKCLYGWWIAFYLKEDQERATWHHLSPVTFCEDTDRKLNFKLEGSTKHKTHEEVKEMLNQKWRALMPLLLVLILATSWALPAEAKFRPLKALKRAACLTVGVVAFPVAAPLNWVVQEAAAEYYMTHGNVRAAHLMLEQRAYDLLWLEDCF